MLKVTEATDSYGQPIAVVRSGRKVVASASIKLVKWMIAKVPDHHLSPTQTLLVQWYNEKTPSSKTTAKPKGAR